jgi:hypothetical protein
MLGLLKTGIKVMPSRKKMKTHINPLGIRQKAGRILENCF